MRNPKGSIWRRTNSPFWTGCYSLRLGDRDRQFKRSLKTEDEDLAIEITRKLQRAAKGLVTAEQAQRFLQEEVMEIPARDAARDAFDHIFKTTRGKGLHEGSFRSYVTTWLAIRNGDLAPSSFLNYQMSLKQFLEHLGGMADQPLLAITSQQIASFRDAEAKRASVSRANLGIKVLRMIFNHAERDELIQRNPAKHVKTLTQRKGNQGRRSFTLPELKKILRCCDTEWRSMVMIGLYGGGIRLGDVARLTWRNIDLDGAEISYQSQKTGRRQSIPFCSELKKHLMEIAGVDDPDQPLHPRAFETVARQNGRVANLSNRFYKILTAAGLVPARSGQRKESTGNDEQANGRATTRQVNELSFHSLRHTATSLLKKAGVGQGVAMDIVGHESPEVSRAYTHIDSETKRAALEKLPSLLD